MKKFNITLSAAILFMLSTCSKNSIIIESANVCGEEKTAIAADYPDFITASRNLDMQYLAKTALNDDQRNYIAALQLLLGRKSDSAEAILSDLVRNAADPLIRNESKLLIETICLAESKWDKFLEVHPEPDSNADIYYSHVKAWSSCAPAEYLFPRNGITAPFEFTRHGQPRVQVMLNGQSFWFILDTGAQFSVISRDVADECGIHPVHIEGIDSGSIFSNPGLVENLAICGVEMRNVPVMIIESKNLDVRLFGLFTQMKIDGIIGWPQLKNFRLELNNIRNTLNILRSEYITTNACDFFFYFRPLVKARAANGATLFFWFDMGKGHTSLFPRGARKTQIDPGKRGVTLSSMSKPMGGTKIQRTSILKNAVFCLSDYAVRFSEILVEKEENPFFDGWMGMDISAKKILIIDYPKGEALILDH